MIFCQFEERATTAFVGIICVHSISVRPSDRIYIIMASSLELGYDLDAAIKRQNISVDDLKRLREETVGIAPRTITDKQLALFLDSCGSVEYARKVIDTYYTVRKNCPEHFAGRDPNSPEIQQCLDNQ